MPDPKPASKKAIDACARLGMALDQVQACVEILELEAAGAGMIQTDAFSRKCDEVRNEAVKLLVAMGRRDQERDDCKTYH